MIYITLILPLCVSVYILSFVKYNWDKRNRMAAIGAILIAIAAIIMPFLIL